jgi:dihydropteroate synthase
MMRKGDLAFDGPGRGVRDAFPPRSSVSPVSHWRVGGEEIDLSSPRVMGILNLTPDSFSDGGTLPSVEVALQRARKMVEEGADILDVGGESTRPGASPVPSEEEIRRILPFIRAAGASLEVPISVDTRKAVVAREALKAGARIVNDVSGLNHDPEMGRVVAEEGGSLILSHMRGTPATMKELAVYRDVLREVGEELGRSLDVALGEGVGEDRIVLDPGIGFAKTPAQSLKILGALEELRYLGRPLLVGVSRKSFIGEVTGLPPADRLPGTLAACVVSFLQGVRIFRVHDVAPLVQALAVVRAIIEVGE